MFFSKYEDWFVMKEEVQGEKMEAHNTVFMRLLSGNIKIIQMRLCIFPSIGEHERARDEILFVPNVCTCSACEPVWDCAE